MKGINWGKAAVKHLQEQVGFKSVAEAERAYKNVYQKIYRTLPKSARGKGTGRTTDINIAREAYFAIYGAKVKVADVSFRDNNMQLSKIPKLTFKYTGSLDKMITAARFEKLANKYTEVNKLINQYSTGKIAYKDLLSKVEKFKKTNQRYQKAGS